VSHGELIWSRIQAGHPSDLKPPSPLLMFALTARGAFDTKSLARVSPLLSTLPVTVHSCADSSIAAGMTSLDTP
jgi:hypothetical protein